jgi:pimeloyl-ACP methyl ester carboxylesterase
MAEMWDLELLCVRSEGEHDGAENLAFDTNDGVIRARHHAGDEGSPAILWVFGSTGGFGGPAGGVYERLACKLSPRFFASLQLDYRYPGNMEACTLDALAGIECLATVDHNRVILVGHSFGGAVAINTAALSEKVAGVVAMSSQLSGTERILQLAQRPLLLLHGAKDEVVPADCSRRLKEMAAGPVELKVYPDCGHGLDECRDRLDGDLTDWLMQFA